MSDYINDDSGPHIDTPVPIDFSAVFTISSMIPDDNKGCHVIETWPISLHHVHDIIGRNAANVHSIVVWPWPCNV